MASTALPAEKEQDAPSDVRLVIAASSAGTVFEWYDFFIYGTLYAVISKAFFPAGNETLSILLTWATFAIGFGFRPIGAILFGYLGDKLGRKYTFLVTVTLMGIATATEASAIGALLALLIVIFRGRFTWANFYSAFLETGRTSAMILFIVVGATAFTGVFNITGGLTATQDLIRGLAEDPNTLLIVMLITVFVLGMFLDWTGIVLLCFPIFLPIVNEMGVSPLWFVVLMAVVLQTSFLSPPFGYALFYMRAISPPEISTGDIIRGVVPFIIMVLIMCGLIVLFPQLVTWLPDTLYRS